MAVEPDMYQCEHCGERWPLGYLDLQPSLFGEKAECPSCRVLAEFTLLPGDAEIDH